MVKDSEFYFLARSVESGKAKFDQITVNAESLATEIEAKSKVSVYGIYFDIDNSDVKRESLPMHSEIARLIQLRPQFSLYVDGRTDNQGADDYNLELSRRCAAATVDALVTNHGIDAARVEPRGFVSSSPADKNDTEEGRAKNRRVKLVAKAY